MADDKDPQSPDTTPQTDRDLLVGGPGQEPAPAPQTQSSRVKYGGRDYEMPADVAEAWNAREREFSQKLTQTGHELGELRKVRQEWETTKAAIAGPKPAAEPDLTTLWYEDPTRAAQMIEERVERKIEGRYRQEQAHQKFWDGFYRAHSDLSEDDWVVKAQLERNFSALADLPVAEAQTKLADITRQEILRLSRKRSPDPDARRPLVEPASGDRPPRPAREAEPDGPQSIGDVIRARAARRMKAPGVARGA